MSENGCADSIERFIHILPFIKVTSTTPYIETFEVSTEFDSHGWFAADSVFKVGDNVTWELGVPEGIVVDRITTQKNAWVTNLDGEYKENEFSFVYSPCFNIKELNRPMLVMHLWYNSEEEKDGATVEYSI